jgi:hypothetical protein
MPAQQRLRLLHTQTPAVQKKMEARAAKPAQVYVVCVPHPKHIHAIVLITLLCYWFEASLLVLKA